jgi:hypothetical protein
VAQHYNHVHTAMNEAGLRAVNTGGNKVPVLTGGGDTAADNLIENTTFAAMNALRGVVARQMVSFNAQFGDTAWGQALGRIPGKVIDLATTWLLQKAAEAPSRVLSGVSGTIGDILSRLGIADGVRSAADASKHVLGSRATPQVAAAYALSRLGKYGWSPSQMGSLAALWTGESGWRWNATNPSSGAYGIPQSWPANKLAEAGGDWRSNAFTQIDWGMAYIKSRYSTPENAYQTWLGRAGSPQGKWYDQGGYLPPGITLAINGTGKRERVLTHEQEQAMLAGQRGGLDINVRVQDGQVRGLISAEVDRQFGSLADAQVYGGA